MWFELQHKNIQPLLGTFYDDLGCHTVSPWIRDGNLIECMRMDTRFDHVDVVRLSLVLCFKKLSKHFIFIREQALRNSRSAQLPQSEIIRSREPQARAFNYLTVSRRFRLYSCPPSQR